MFYLILLFSIDGDIVHNNFDVWGFVFVAHGSLRGCMGYENLALPEGLTEWK